MPHKRLPSARRLKPCRADSYEERYKSTYFRNTIFYLTCSESQLGLLQSKLTEYLACERVQHEYSGQLDTDQKRDIADKKNEANAQANAQLISVYNIAMRYSVTDGLEAVELRDFARDMQTQITENCWMPLLKKNG